jgi:3',5'-cyclic AMP phosphodiesterase CpdA
MENGFYFAQLTDVHVGEGLNPKEAARNLRWALDELETLIPKPELILVTADLVCAGKASELSEYAEIVKGHSIPSFALPANHDLWGEADEKAEACGRRAA